MARISLAGKSGDDFKAAKAAYMREYRKDNPEKFRLINIKKKFGMEAEHYYTLLEKQGGVCAICQQPERKVDYRTGRTLNLAIDHDHTTGQIRGLLCADCNRALGMFQDNTEILRRAADYLAGA